MPYTVEELYWKILSGLHKEEKDYEKEKGWDFRLRLVGWGGGGGLEPIKMTQQKSAGLFYKTIPLRRTP